MRIFVLFALALTATAVLTDDVSAIGKRKRGASSGCGGCSTPVVATPPCGGCPGAPGYMGAPGTGRVGHTSGIGGGQITTVQATDGQFYTMGANGYYYPTSSISTMGGFTSQPYGTFYYPTTPGYVYPAGGTPPLTMPGTTIPGTMPPRR